MVQNTRQAVVFVGRPPKRDIFTESVSSDQFKINQQGAERNRRSKERSEK